MREQAIRAMVWAYIDAGSGSPEFRMAHALEALLALLRDDEDERPFHAAARAWFEFEKDEGRKDFPSQLRTALTAALSTLADKGDDHDAG